VLYNVAYILLVLYKMICYDRSNIHSTVYKGWSHKVRDDCIKYVVDT